MFEVSYQREWLMNTDAKPAPQPEPRKPEVAEPDDRKAVVEVEGAEEESGYGYGV